MPPAKKRKWPPALLRRQRKNASGTAQKQGGKSLRMFESSLSKRLVRSAVSSSLAWVTCSLQHAVGEANDDVGCGTADPLKGRVVALLL